MTELTIRSYKPDDLEDCRELWEFLTQCHRDIYDDQTIGGDDPGAYFDEHLELVGPDLVWLGEKDGAAVGMISLMKGSDDGWEIEPIVIKPEFRGQGIGRRLIEHVIEEARTRDIKFLSIKPVFRNREAITIFHKLGFDKVGRIELFMQLDDKKRTWKPGARFNDLDFEY
ncbi:MAG: GNAT family N-acetyltransferase [Thermoplasmata archaeon]|nr:GNAT family N-acetyltransferase [Thermoplasmata archaeon]